MPSSIAKRGVPKELLIQILEQPGIVSTVQSLEPAVLHAWISRVGLEEAGELVALASSAQLLSMLDLDVWCSDAAGVDESFDAERFALWVEVLLDSGVRGAVQKIAELDEDMLTLALCRHTFVIDVEALARRMSSGHYDEDEEGDPDLMLKELEGSLSQDFEQFRVIARSARSWEPIRTLLVELDAAEPDLFARLLERCTHISLEYIADNGGLYEVLSSGEMVDVDVAGAREDRRSAQGYVAPSAARAFLAHARVEPLADVLGSESADPITHAYYRAAARSPAPRHVGVGDTPPASVDKAGVRALMETLRELEVLPSTPAAPLLLGAGEQSEASHDPLIVRAVRELLPEHPAAHAARVDELAYLANVVLAGSSSREDELRGADAARAALAICDWGVDTLFAEVRPRTRCRAVAAWLRDHSLVKLFRIGWHQLGARAPTGQSDPEIVRAVIEQRASAPVIRQQPARLRSTRTN